MHTHAYIHTYTYTHIHTYAHTHRHRHIHIDIDIEIDIDIHAYTCVHAYMHTYIHIYKHVHTYMHTYITPRVPNCLFRRICSLWGRSAHIYTYILTHTVWGGVGCWEQRSRQRTSQGNALATTPSRSPINSRGKPYSSS